MSLRTPEMPSPCLSFEISHVLFLDHQPGDEFEIRGISGLFLLVGDNKIPAGLQPGSGPFLERADDCVDQQIAVLVHLGAVFRLL